MRPSSWNNHQETCNSTFLRGALEPRGCEQACAGYDFCEWEKYSNTCHGYTSSGTGCILREYSTDHFFSWTPCQSATSAADDELLAPYMPSGVLCLAAEDGRGSLPCCTFQQASSKCAFMSKRNM